MFKIEDNVIIKKLSEHDKTSDLLNDSSINTKGQTATSLTSQKMSVT